MVTKQTEKNREKKLLLIEELGGKCVVCGSTTQLQFDHIDSKSKSFDITTNLNLSNEKLRAELVKCQLLCMKHHIDKSIIDHGKSPAKHGSISMYANHRCRCRECRDANTRATASRLERRRLKVPKAHGRSTYVNWGCRCDVCKEDHAAYSKEARERRKRR